MHEQMVGDWPLKFLSLLIRNWPLKLLSLIVAFSLWVTVTGESRILSQDLTVPLEIDLDDDSTLLGSPPITGTVRVRGPEIALRRIDPLRHEMELRVDLRETTPGERTIQLSRENLVGLPRGVDVESIVPDRLNLEVDQKVRRELAVAPTILGKPPKGYHSYGARAAPRTLTVEGPKSKVDALSRLRTDPIQLEDHTEPFVVRVGALPDSPDIRVLDPGLLEVRVEVDATPTEVAFQSVPVVLTGQVYETSTSPSTLQIVLSGPPLLLGRIQPGQVRALVDVSELAPRAEPYALTPRVDYVDVPAGDLPRITVKSVNREKISVRVSGRRISE